MKPPLNGSQSTTNQLNNWSDCEVFRAESTWGQTYPSYTLEMFNFATTNVSSFLDLACGFGRFLEFLTKKVEEPNYIGYDSSNAMVSRISERFPEYKNNIFLQNITSPIFHKQESIIISAVFIHITTKDQQEILTNLSNISKEVKKITFDINSPCEKEISRVFSPEKDHYERYIKTSKDSQAKFRMTWQSHYSMTEKILTMFPDFNLNISFHDLKAGRHKVLYMLERRN